MKWTIVVFPMKTTHYLTSTIQEGNRLEIDLPSLPVGQKVEVIILIISEPETKPAALLADRESFTNNRKAFLRLPMAERGRILEQQAELALAHYQQDSEWQEWADIHKL